MKLIILAGGHGSRISEESISKPKPLIEIGGKPIIWHIMKHYSTFGINDFVICCGYKGYLLKEYFSNYFLHTSDVTFDFESNKTTFHESKAEPWRVTLVDTGQNTLTGGRLLKIKHLLKKAEVFCMTYGDGLSNVNIAKLIESHYLSKKLATVTAVIPPGRFGSLEIVGENVKSFTEKPPGDSGYVNGGFFVLNESVISYIDNDQTQWEREPLQKLAVEGELSAFHHGGFWQPMDTLREKNLLNDLWESNDAPWKSWI